MDGPPIESRHAFGGLSLLAALAAGLLMAAVPAQAADSCPNATTREQQGSADLRACRAYELISPARKDGAQVVTVTEGSLGGFGRGADDGNRAIFAASAAIGDAPGAPSQTHFLARRGSGGWASDSLNVRQNAASGLTGASFNSGGANADLSKVVLQFEDPPPVPAPLGEPNLFVRDSASGQFTLLTVEPPFQTWPTLANGPAFIGGSSDLGHVAIVTGSDGWYSADGAGKQGVYLSAGGELDYVGYDESGAPIPEGVTVPSIVTLTPGSDDFVSEDGSSLVFGTACADYFSGCNLWVRRNGTTTQRITRPDPGVADPGEVNALFDGFTKDGRFVYFTTGAALKADGLGGLYRYEIATDTLTKIADRAVGVVGLSDDGSRVYFTVDGGISLWEDGEVSVVAPNTMPYPINYTIDTKVSPDGRYLGFSSRAPLTTDPIGGADALYVYDAVSGETACASCRDSGVPNDIDVVFRTDAPPVHGGRARNLSADGRFVFFQSVEPLVSTDTNGLYDVYQWDRQTGDVSLITTGTDGFDSWFLDASADGSTVFFTTHARLTGWDVDSDADLYAARVDGGFPEPSPPAVACREDECQGPVPPPPSLASAGTVSFVGPGDAKPTPAGRATVSKPKVVRGSNARLRVRVPSAGAILVSGARVERAGKRVGAKGAYSVRVRLGAAARRALRREGSLRVRVRVSFTPRTGSSSATTVSLTFKRSGAKGR